ncbi:hypothetical protein FRC02_012340 [Tulasnella sp. 418]|nr:hypothetical protein FRC02_012340 [Tulasnella sp. 418]
MILLECVGKLLYPRAKNIFSFLTRDCLLNDEFISLRGERERMKKASQQPMEQANSLLTAFYEQESDDAKLRHQQEMYELQADVEELPEHKFQAKTSLRNMGLMCSNIKAENMALKGQIAIGLNNYII